MQHSSLGCSSPLPLGIPLAPGLLCPHMHLHFLRTFCLFRVNPSFSPLHQLPTALIMRLETVQGPCKLHLPILRKTATGQPQPFHLFIKMQRNKPPHSLKCTQTAPSQGIKAPGAARPGAPTQVLVSLPGCCRPRPRPFWARFLSCLEGTERLAT